MGIIGTLVLIAVVLKLLGLALVATSWWTIFGAYIAAIVVFYVVSFVLVLAYK